MPRARHLAAASAAVLGTAGGWLAPAPAWAAGTAPIVYVVGGQCGGPARAALAFRFWDDRTPVAALRYGIAANSNPGLFTGLPWRRVGPQHRLTLDLRPAAQGAADLVVAVTDAERRTRRFPFTVRAGAGVLSGGPRTDVVVGGQGANTVTGLGGDDILCGNHGDDTLDGGPGRDLIDGSSGSDRIAGGAGNDSIGDFYGDDTVDGGAGDDLISAGRGADTLHGGDGDDHIWAGTGDDTVRGGPGDDDLRGEDGFDTLHGEAGDDLLRPGGGADLQTGGTGADRFLLGGGARPQDYQATEGDVLLPEGTVLP